MGSSLSLRPLLLLLLGLSLIWGSLQALTCFQCDLINVNGVCERGKSSCVAKGSQQCFLKKIYEGNKFQSGSQGCRDLCIPMTLFRPKIQVELNCCSKASFCNKV